MTRMNRYRGYRTSVRTNRYRPILFLLLLLALAFLVFKLAGVGGLDENNYQSQRNAILRGEIQHAVSTVNTLSRLGATTTSAALGRVRQYIHGMETLNELNVSLYGEVGRLYPQSTFDDIYAIINEYDTRLISGSQVNDVLTQLSEAVEALNNTTLAMLGGATAEE